MREYKVISKCDVCGTEGASSFSVSVGRSMEAGTGSMTDTTIDFELCSKHMRRYIERSAAGDQGSFLHRLYGIDVTPK